MCWSVLRVAGGCTCFRSAGRACVTSPEHVLGSPPPKEPRSKCFLTLRRRRRLCREPRVRRRDPRLLLLTVTRYLSPPHRAAVCLLPVMTRYLSPPHREAVMHLATNCCGRSRVPPVPLWGCSRGLTVTSGCRHPELPTRSRGFPFGTWGVVGSVGVRFQDLT